MPLPPDLSIPARLPRDDNRVLAMLRRPPPSWDRPHMVRELCYHGREHLVRRAIEEGIIRLDGRPEIVNAVAMLGSAALLRYLVSERWLDPNQRDRAGFTPLHGALIGDKDQSALFLINEAGVDVNCEWQEGMTPLGLAAGKGYVEVLKALVAKGADVNVVMTGGTTAEEKHAEAALYLLEQAGASWAQHCW